MDPLTEILTTILGVGGGGGTLLAVFLGLQKLGLIKNGGNGQLAADAQAATAATLEKTMLVLQQTDQKLDQIIEDTKHLPQVELKIDHLATDLQRVETKLAAG